MTFTYPHTIENGHGEILTFERRVMTPKGEQVEGWNRVTRPGAGPPFHTHFHEEESFTVREGRLGYQLLGGPEQFAEVGETVTFPKGTPHRFWNAGEGDLRCAASIRPPGNIEYFLGAIFEAQKNGSGGRPNLMDASYLLWRYRSEYRMDEMPWLVRTVVTPIVALVAGLAGRRRKYADAPPPRGSRTS